MRKSRKEAEVVEVSKTRIDITLLLRNDFLQIYHDQFLRIYSSYDGHLDR